MPYLFAILISALALGTSACKSSDQPGASAASAASTRTPRKSTRTITATTIGNDSATNKPAVRPVNLVNGRIVGSRDALRFVIIDFQNSRMPQLDQVLHVYRLDQKVAEVKISGPYLGTTVAADVIAGEAAEGDLVRDRPMPTAASISPGK
jgi:hypothetical protein